MPSVPWNDGQAQDNSRGNAHGFGLAGRGHGTDLLGDPVGLVLIGPQELPRSDFLVANPRHGIAAQIDDHVVDAETCYTDKQKRAQDFSRPGFCKITQTIKHLKRSTFGSNPLP